MLNTPPSETKTLCDASTQHSQTAPGEVECFCLDNPRHSELLREWCRLCWSTIKKSMESYNPAVYHECCFCFSRRGFAKKAGHCEMQSVSVLKMPSLKALQGPEDLYKWVLDRIKLHHRLGRRPVFPALNRYHTDVEDESEDTEKQIEHLGKRCDQLELEVKELQTENRRLRSDNSRLLESSQSWCQRYQESLEWVEKPKVGRATPEQDKWVDSSPLFSN
jgi:regulator of replication initiation timing